VPNADAPYTLDISTYGTVIIRRADGSAAFTLDEFKHAGLALELLDNLNSPEPL
jgi:hypothetical protein